MLYIGFKVYEINLLINMKKQKDFFIILIIFGDIFSISIINITIIVMYAYFIHCYSCGKICNNSLVNL